MATYHLRRWSPPPTFPGNELYKEPWDWMMDNDYIDGWWIIIIDDYNNDNDDDDDATCCHASQTPHRCSIVAYSYHKRSKPSGKPGDHNGDHHDHQLHHAHYLLPPHHHHPQHPPPPHHHHHHDLFSGSPNPVWMCNCATALEALGAKHPFIEIGLCFSWFDFEEKVILIFSLVVVELAEDISLPGWKHWQYWWKREWW